MNGISDLNFKNLLEYAQVGVIIHNWNTSIVYINPIGLQLLNLDYEQAIGRDTYDPSLTQDWLISDSVIFTASKPILSCSFTS